MNDVARDTSAMTFALKLTPELLDRIELKNDGFGSWTDLGCLIADWRALVAEVERLQARLDAMGTVTEYDAEVAADVYDRLAGAVGDAACDPIAMMNALEAFARGKDGDATLGIDQTKFWTFGYKNHRGEYAIRQAVPLGVRFGSTEWHTKPQWLLRGYDIAKQAEREFAMDDIQCQAVSENHPALQSHGQVCEADLHGRGKFGGPLAEQYVEQADEAENDQDLFDIVEMARDLSDKTTGTPVFELSAHEVVENAKTALARRATTPDPRDAQIAKLREALEDALSAPRDGTEYQIRRSRARRVLEETRGES